MKKIIRILSVVILVALILCVMLCGCTPPQSPIWIAVKSVGGNNGLFAEGQDFNFTLFFGSQEHAELRSQIAVITVKNTADGETRTFVIDDFGDEKYEKPEKHALAPTLKLTYPAPANQPCIGDYEIVIKGYKDEAARQAEEVLSGQHCTIIYLAESGVGTIIGNVSIEKLWKRRCNILLFNGKLTLIEYNSEMRKLGRGASTVRHDRGVSSEWTETGLDNEGYVSFIETAESSGVVSGTFTSTTDSEAVSVSYITQLDSAWYKIPTQPKYDKYKQLFSLTAETENGVETWFVLYKDGKLTLSKPVSGWCSFVNGDTINISDSQNNGIVTRYMFSDDMTLIKLEIDN